MMTDFNENFSNLYTLEFEKRNDYLYAYVGKGKDSLVVSKSFWSKALGTCSRINCNKMLIEEDLDGKLSSSDIYELSVGIANSPFKDIKVAFVDRRLEHKKSNEFGESIVTTRGLKIKVLSTIKEAEEWLLSN